VNLQRRKVSAGLSTNVFHKTSSINAFGKTQNKKAISFDYFKTWKEPSDSMEELTKNHCFLNGTFGT